MKTDVDKFPAPIYSQALMTSSTLTRASAAILLAHALLITAPTIAATPKRVTAKQLVLTCKTATPEGLTYTAIKPGKGDKPGADAKVKVNYKGMLTSDGSEFDAGQDAEFKVGGVIPGFAQGLQLMQPGGEYRLCIPSKLGYGEAGTGSIPANADLVFEVELLSFTTPPPKPIVPLAERVCDKTAASGLGYLAIKAGSGKVPTDTDMTLVDFTTFDAKTGMTLEKREWEIIPLAQATPVFAEALKLMQVGSSYTFCLPNPKATDAAAAAVPDINIRVDLLDVRPAPAAE
jgi:FKBP-type peptidyl-prolyl cis-trans isomerase